MELELQCWGNRLQVVGALAEAVGFFILAMGIRTTRRGANLPSAWAKRRAAARALIDRLRGKTQVVQPQSIGSSESFGSATVSSAIIWGTTLQDDVEQLKRIAEKRSKVDKDIYQRISSESEKREGALAAVTDALKQFEQEVEKRRSSEAAQVVRREGLAIV